MFAVCVTFRIRKEQMQKFIDAKCSDFLSNVKNQENLMRALDPKL